MKSIGAVPNIYYSTSSLIITPEKDLILTGNYRDTSNAQSDAILVKITNNLDTLWTRKYDASDFDRFWSTALVMIVDIYVLARCIGLLQAVTRQYSYLKRIKMARNFGENNTIMGAAVEL